MPVPFGDGVFLIFTVQCITFLSTLTLQNQENKLYI